MWARNGGTYLDLFNLGADESVLSVELKQLGLNGIARVRDLWEKKDLSAISLRIEASILPHGCRLYKLS
jgi:alpha-galactosidase